MPVDILAIAAHRDDVELTCAGTLLKAADAGYRTGILDLTAGETGTLGTGPVTNNAALVFDRAGTLTVNAPITGMGSLTQAGSGTIVLGADNSYSGDTTIAAGTLQVGAGGTSGSLGTGRVINNGTLAVNRTDTVELGGSISGSNSNRPNLFDTGDDCGTAAGGTAGDVVYSFKIENAPVEILFSTCDDADFDTMISLWNDCTPGTDASSNYLDCNDDVTCSANTSSGGRVICINGTRSPPGARYFMVAASLSPASNVSAESRSKSYRVARTCLS